MAREDLTGRTFTRLRVIRQDGYYTNKTLRKDGTYYLSRSPMWLCECECGNTTRVQGRSLLGGLTKSCGCLRRETARRMVLDVDSSGPHGKTRVTLTTGDYMRRAREEAKLTQAELADKAGVARGTLARIERGNQQGTLSTVILLADALGLPLDEYVGRRCS